MTGLNIDDEHTAYVTAVRTSIATDMEGVHPGFIEAIRSEFVALEQMCGLLIRVIATYTGPGGAGLKVCIRREIEFVHNKMKRLLIASIEAPSSVTVQATNYEAAIYVGGVDELIEEITTNPRLSGTAVVAEWLDEPHSSWVNAQKSELSYIIRFLNDLRREYRGPFHRVFKVYLITEVINASEELIRRIENGVANGIDAVH